MSDERHLPPPLPPDGTGQLVLYRTEDGRTRISCRFQDQSAWLTQAAIAELFQTTPQNITLHIGAIYEDAELREEATCKEYLQVRQEGSRQVTPIEALQLERGAGGRLSSALASRHPIPGNGRRPSWSSS